MDKFLEDHRRLFGEFEIIDYVDTDEIERLRSETSSDTAVTVNWTWEYGSEVGELRRLYEKGKVNQWNAQTDIDWDLPISKDEWLVAPERSVMAQILSAMGADEATQKAAAFDEVAFLLSQLLHGEQAALQLCGQLTNVCDVMDQKWYAASQVIDEARHIEVLAKFLGDEMGTLYPVHPFLKALLDELLHAESIQKKTLGMQCLFEGTAVGIMDTLRGAARNELMSTMLRRIEQDESRHAAFGVLCMRRIVEEAEKEELEEMEDWSYNILETLNASEGMAILRTLGPKYGIDADLTMPLLLESDDFAEFNSRIFMHTVVPNLRRLGLLTERTEDKWRSVKMIWNKNDSQAAA